MSIPTNYLSNKGTERSTSLVLGTKPFWTIGVDVNGKSLFFIMINTHRTNTGSGRTMHMQGSE